MDITFETLRIIVLLLPGFITQGITTAYASRFPLAKPLGKELPDVGDEKER